MICENCKNEINETSKICSYCGAIVRAESYPHNMDVMIEQPVVNQVIAEEHKDKKTKNSKKQILTIISIIFFSLSIGTIILANIIDKESNSPVEIPALGSEKGENVKDETKSIIYKGYNVSYLADYDATIEEGLLILENKDLYFQLTLHADVTNDKFEQNKNNLKQILLNNGYVIESEETTIRNGIEFLLLNIYNIIENERVDYDYFLAVEKDVLYEILVLNDNNDNYSKVSKQLRTIVKGTKLAN